MRFRAYEIEGALGLATWSGDRWIGLLHEQPDAPGPLEELLMGDRPLGAVRDQILRSGAPLGPDVKFRPPLSRPGKIICVGLNYRDHSAESPYAQPDNPTYFARFATSLVGHDQPIVRPSCSEQLDFEGELVAIIGKRGRHIPVESALDHVVGWSIFNEASIRDYQFKSPQWTLGKNFDGTGAFGPAFVTADEVPRGGRGLSIQTRLNGEVVQSANTSDMVFDVATQISLFSEAITIEPGDVFVTGTPAGVGFGRTPKLWMKPGDIVEVEIEGLGVLRNPIVQEQRLGAHCEPAPQGGDDLTVRPALEASARTR